MREVIMDTKPTPTLAKLHISQEKYEYALAVYLYLQEKEQKSYQEDIRAAIDSLCEIKWGDYAPAVKKVFSKKEMSQFGIIPEDLLTTTNKALSDIKSEFEEGAKEQIGKEESDSQKDEEISAEDNTTDSTALQDGDQDLPDLPESGDKPDIEPEEVPVIEKKQSADEDLVPGLDDFASNYKREVTQGLMEEDSSTEDKTVEKKLQDDIDQKLVNVLRMMRGMTSEDISKKLYAGLKDGKKLEDLTLGDLEELFD